MLKYNIRFADFATRAALFELQVEQGLTVGALKAMAEEHLLNSDDLCPMKYFDKWCLEVRVGDRKKQVGIDEDDEGLALAAAGLEDESVVYLEGPIFEEEQAEVGRAIAAVRVQAKAQALHLHGLVAEMGRRLDAIAAKQQEQLEEFAKALKNHSEELLSIITAGQQKKWKAEIGRLFRRHGNRPLKALWEVLNDKAKHGIELPMAIIMDRRCGIERRAELADGEMDSGKGYTINNKDREGATPLIMAVQASRNDVVSALLANDADYETTFGTGGFSALHIAALNNNVGAIELLASYGADVSKLKNDNFTPLHIAAINGNAAAIEAFVGLGADLTIINCNAHTPLQTMESRLLTILPVEKERLKALLTPKNILVRIKGDI